MVRAKERATAGFEVLKSTGLHRQILQIKLINTTEAFDQLEDDWNHLVEQTDVHVYQTFDWNRTWWESFGKEGTLFIVAFYESDKLVGLLPLFWDIVSVLGIRLYSCLRFIGSNITQPKGERLLGLMAYSSYLDIIIHPDYETAVYQKLRQHLKQFLTSCDQIILDEVPRDSSLFDFLKNISDSCQMEIEVRDDSAVFSTSFEDSWESYLKSLSKNTRSHARRALKKIYHQKKRTFRIHDVEYEQELVQ